MTSLPALLIELAAGLPGDEGGNHAGVALQVESVSLALPIELRFDRRGRVGAGLPRCRMATGFDLPLSTLRATFERGAA